MGAESKALHDVSDQVMEVELERVNLKASCLDLGKIQDLVDDREQRFGGELHGGEIFALFRREAGFQSELGHADDAVHGRANLVAHIGQERALGTACSLRLLLCRGEFKIDCPALQ